MRKQKSFLKSKVRRGIKSVTFGEDVVIVSCYVNYIMSEEVNIVQDTDESDLDLDWAKKVEDKMDALGETFSKYEKEEDKSDAYA